MEVERTFALGYETASLRRLHVSGTQNVQKKLLLRAACNLALQFRKMSRAGLHDRPTAWWTSVFRFVAAYVGHRRTFRTRSLVSAAIPRRKSHRHR